MYRCKGNFHGADGSSLSVSVKPTAPGIYVSAPLLMRRMVKPRQEGIVWAPSGSHTRHVWSPLSYTFNSMLIIREISQRLRQQRHDYSGNWKRKCFTSTIN